METPDFELIGENVDSSRFSEEVVRAVRLSLVIGIASPEVVVRRVRRTAVAIVPQPITAIARLSVCSDAMVVRWISRLAQVLEGDKARSKILGLLAWRLDKIQY